MLLFVGGICCHNWTDEPKYPDTDVPIRHADDCTEEDRADFCKVSWVNYEDKKESHWWTPCTY